MSSRYDGMDFDPARCAALVWRGWDAWQCSRKPKVGDWCKQHSPEAVAERERAADERDEADIEARLGPRRKLDALRDAVSAFLATCPAFEWKTYRHPGVTHSAWSPSGFGVQTQDVAALKAALERVDGREGHARGEPISSHTLGRLEPRMAVLAALEKLDAVESGFERDLWDLAGVRAALHEARETLRKVIS